MYINVDVRIKFYNLKEYVFFMNIYLILKFIRYTESSIAFLAMVFLFEKKNEIRIERRYTFEIRRTSLN